MTSFSEYQGKDLWLAGEGYAGVMIPFIVKIIKLIIKYISHKQY